MPTATRARWRLIVSTVMQLVQLVKEIGNISISKEEWAPQPGRRG